VLRHVRSHCPQMWVSVSATTRSPRPLEVEGVSYSYHSVEQFRQMVDRGEFLEWAEFAGHLYGTPRLPVLQHRQAGTPVLLEIELQGARQIRRAVPDALLVFLAPPSWDELVRRLTGRGTESPAEIENRLRVARQELDAEAEFDVTLVNTSVTAVADELMALLHTHRGVTSQ
jgi:guanylate kinase